MRRLISIGVILAFMIGVLPAAAQPGGFDITCPNGTSILNAVEVSINMRAGFEYTATAIGKDGFDPAIAVGENGSASLCNDDDSTAARYRVGLPSSGELPASGSSAQMPFSYSGSGFGNISIFVGSPDGAGGEFVLVLEGMAVTQNDGRGAGAGDPLAVRLASNVVNTDAGLNVYMISKITQLDPLVQLVDVDKNVITLDNGETVQCDDAGNSQYCWNEGVNLRQSYVATGPNTGTPGGDLDAMLAISLQDWTLNDDPDSNWLNFLMTSSSQRTFGEYLIAVHMSTEGSAGAASASSSGGGDGSDRIDQLGAGNSEKPGTGGGTTDKPGTDGGTDKPGGQTVGSPGGLDVRCPDGTNVRNGVEVLVNMRSGFSYNATVVGVNGFDPAIAVGEAGSIELCNDNEPDAAQYAVGLPGTGDVPAARATAQVPFSYTGSGGFGNVSLVVGSADGSAGEFILILEGMAVTQNDGRGAGAGDPFAVRLAPNVVDTGVPLEIFMISKISQLDPFLQLVDSENAVIVLDGSVRVECDDAGNGELCWNTGDNLRNAYVLTGPNRGTPGGDLDAMLSISLEGWTLNDDPDSNWLNFLMTSTGQRTFGEYIAIFRMATR